MTNYQQGFTNAAMPYGIYVLLSSEPGTFRLWCETAPMGMQEVLLYGPPSNAGWVTVNASQPGHVGTSSL